MTTGAGQRGQRRHQQKHGKALDAAQIPAAARNLTSPKPRPWICLKAKYSRRSSQKMAPMAAPSNAASRPAGKPPTITAFDSPRPPIVKFNQSGMSSVTDVDPGKDDTQQAEQSKRYEDDHAGA